MEAYLKPWHRPAGKILENSPSEREVTQQNLSCCLKEEELP